MDTRLVDAWPEGGSDMKYVVSRDIGAWPARNVDRKGKEQLYAQAKQQQV